MKYDNCYQLIGNTPLIKINSLSKQYNCNIYLKLEKYNFTGSSKDRAVKNMILNAIKDNKINANTTIIEASSGNTGIALAGICASLKLKCIIVINDNVSNERIKILKMLGSKVILIPSIQKMKGCINKVNELLKSINNSYSLSQFNNINNRLAHYQYTAKEIVNDLNEIDGFFCSAGTYGTLQGISMYLKEFNDKIKVIEARPIHKNHRITGTFSNVKPDKLLMKYVDQIIKVEDLDSIKMVKEIAKQEGIMIGLSSGLALASCVKYLSQNKLNNVVVLCPDGLDRYYSCKYLFDETYDIKEDINYIHKILFSKDDYYLDDIFIKYGIYEKEIKKIRKLLDFDCKAIYQMDPSAISKKQIIDIYPGFFAILVYRIANLINAHGDKVLSRKLSEYAHSVTGIDIHPEAKIGKSFAIDHGTSIVIGQTTIIGNNVRIYQGVTLGALSLSNAKQLIGKKRHPTIKNNVIIYAGASILGGNTIIGNNVTIGSNVFVTSSIKDNVTVLLSNKNYTIKEK